MGIPYLTFVTEFPMMKLVELMNDLMIFNVGSLIRAGSCKVFCFGVICVWLKPKTFCEFCHSYVVLSFYKCFWGMCIALGGQICFVLQVICFHFWLDLSMDYKVNCLLCLVVVGFLSRF
jgi:hypothetical protein